MQNRYANDPLEAVPSRSFHTFVISKLGCCLLISEFFLAYFLMKMKCIFWPWIVYSVVTLIIIFFLHSKKSLCFLHWILHYFLCLKPLAIFYRYYSLELENIDFIFMGMFWFVLDLEYVSDPCGFESLFAWGDFFFILHAKFFSAW